VCIDFNIIVMNMNMNMNTNSTLVEICSSSKEIIEFQIRKKTKVKDASSRISQNAGFLKFKSFPPT
jgi:hypothetical protein